MHIDTPALRLAAAGLTLTLVGCGGSSSPTSPSGSATFSGQATASDAAGDARTTSVIPVSPDLTSGGVEVSGGTARFHATVAAGTLDVPSTCLVFDLDTDQNSATGVPMENGVLGFDYSVQVQNNRYTVLRCVNLVCSPTGGGDATTSGLTLEARVPLSSLGNDDGRMTLKQHAIVNGSNGNSGPVDFMPDIGSGVTRLQ